MTQKNCASGELCWEEVWALARESAQICVQALRVKGFRVDDPEKLEKALTELFLPALRLRTRRKG